MEIKIIRTSNNIILDQHKALWEFVKNKKSVSATLLPILSLVIGVVTILICIFLSKYGENFWSFQSTLAFVLIILAIRNYIFIYNRKQLFFSQTKKTIENLNNNNSITEILLTESKLKIKDFQSYYELNWTVFNNIQQNKGYFFLMYDKSYQNGVIISKSELTKPQLDKFSDFIQIIQ